MFTMEEIEMDKFFNIYVLIHLKITIKLLHVNINNTFYEK